jgi:hypothetical protein
MHVMPSAIDRLVHHLRTDISPRAYILSKRIPGKLRRLEESGILPLYHYVLATSNVVTEPQTATLLLQLRVYPREGSQMVNFSSFAQDMVQQLNLTWDEARGLVERAVKKRYVVNTDQRGLFIVEAERTLHEEPFLKLLARHSGKSRAVPV